MENKKEFRTWLDAMQLSHPLVIAGPCSAETEAQLHKIAQQLKDTDATVLRAGIWKPRTRPGNFEGVGALGLQWLQDAKKATGMLTATEVANPSHVALALEYDVDILWLGARTTVSPFIVQEIAAALEGTDKIVLIKNPVNPDLALWLGAVERIHSAGISKLGVIHRGFSTYKKTGYRNNPQWQIPIDLKAAFPDLPIICDPSHIGGRRNLIFDICQTALDLQFDGLMVETHYDPEQAWSDAKQQITPATLVQYMEDLRIRNFKFNDEEIEVKMDSYRREIRSLDQQIIEMLGDRMKIADEIGALKKKKNVAILQSNVWTKTMQRMMQEGKENGLSESFIEKMFKAIHEESIQHQKKMF